MNVLINLLIILLPFGVVFRFLVFPDIYLYPIDIVAGLILLTFLYQIIIRKQKIVRKDLFYPILAFLSVGLISLIVNSGFLNPPSFLVSLLYLVRFASYVSIAFSFQFVSENFKKTLNYKLLASGALFVLFGFIQYFYYPNLRNLYYLGWDDHLYRLFSTFLDPNFAGAFLVLFFLFVAELVIKVFSKKQTKSLLVYSFISIGTLIAIYLTYSRSAFIMLVVGVVVLLMSNKLFKQTALAAVILIVLFALFANTKTEGTNPFRIASSEARLQTAGEAIFIIEKNPILGVGFNAYRYAQVRYNVRTTQVATISNADAGTDNSFLLVLATTGVIGFVPFVLFWIRILQSSKSGLLPASVAALLLDSLFINSLFYIFTMAWIFLLVGVASSKKE